MTSDDLQGCGRIDERMDCSVQSHLIVSRRASPPSPNLMASTLGHAPISEARVSSHSVKPSHVEVSPFIFRPNELT